MVRNDTSGHQRTPADTSGHQRTPADTSGHQRTPADTSPADTSGHQRTPADTSGHQRTPADTSGHQRTPAATRHGGPGIYHRRTGSQRDTSHVARRGVFIVNRAKILCFNSKLSDCYSVLEGIQKRQPDSVRLPLTNSKLISIWITESIQ